MVVTQEDDCSYDDNEIESFVDDDDDDEEDNQDEHQRHQLEVRYNELSTIKNVY